MLARSLLRPSRLEIAQSTTRRGRASPCCHQSSCRRDPRAAQGQSSNRTRQSLPLRGSVRPFTVLAICIPLGYAINWALKRDGAGQVSPDGFVKYTLADREPVSSTCSIFTLIPSFPSAAIDTKSSTLARAITSVQFKQPQLQIARSYTILPPVRQQHEDELRFLIKREQRGEVSGYLHRLPLEDEVEVRGVSKEYSIPKGVEKVVFLAGGTGIVPAMQIADMLKNEKADVHVLWANRKREDCSGGQSDSKASPSGSWWGVSRLWSGGAPQHDAAHMSAQANHQIVTELERLKEVTDKAGGRFKIDYFVDEENTFVNQSHVKTLLADHSAPVLENASSKRKLLIVSGPEGFVNYWAGPKQWLNGREVQGPLAGVLGQMTTTGWEVVKL